MTDYNNNDEFTRHEVKPGERYKRPDSPWIYTVLAVTVVGWQNREIAWCKVENGREIDTKTAEPLTDEPLFRPENRLVSEASPHTPLGTVGEDVTNVTDIPWMGIPVLGLLCGLGAFLLLGALRLLVAGFIAAFIPSESDTILGTVWNNGKADGFIEATHFLHGQLSYGVGLVITLFLIVVKLLGGKFRTNG